ncbi:hypothetical protein AB0C11_33400 [Streptomyces sp. NPDC039016]|uniref:hypothetical protein n=1 Tax=Streptomyces sp. NPDC039016 TaxID=3154330 RepID=UPI00341033F9
MELDIDKLTLAALGGFGFLSLVITLLVGLLRQLPDLVAAYREARDALRNRRAS